MKKCILIFLISFVFLGCSKYGRINEVLYNNFFKDMIGYRVFKLPDAIMDIDDLNEVNIFKEEVKNFELVDKYTGKPNYGSVFKNENYRTMLIRVKKNDKPILLEVLYSTKDKVMIVRESDLFPETSKNSGDEITVYEFKVPSKVNQMIKNHEKQLPEEGFFCNTWSGF